MELKHSRPSCLILCARAAKEEIKSTKKTRTHTQTPLRLRHSLIPILGKTISAYTLIRIGTQSVLRMVDFLWYPIPSNTVLSPSIIAMLFCQMYLKIGDRCKSFDRNVSIVSEARTREKCVSSASSSPHDYGYCWCVSVFQSIWLNRSIHRSITAFCIV